MNKSTRLFCILAMAAALALSGALALKSVRKAADLSSLEKELTVSRTHWETVAAEKEALQEELAEVSGQLREARLTIEESEARAAELRQEIAQLESELLALRSHPERTETPPASP